MIPGDLLSAFPHRQFHTLPGLLDSWAALPNSNPNACMPMQEAVCTIFMMVFGMTDPSQPDTVRLLVNVSSFHRYHDFEEGMPEQLLNRFKSDILPCTK